MNLNKERLSSGEIILYGGLYLAGALIISFLFYDSLIPAFLFCPGLKFYFKKIRIYLMQKQQQLLLTQFRDMMSAICASLHSGYSMENAVRESYKELRVIYGENSMICLELKTMAQRLNVNIPIEQIFQDFALRSGCNDILMFAQILLIAKRSGGDLISIIRSSSETIGEKISLKKEILTATSAKRMEQMIMFFMPVAIMFYIRLTSHDFFDSVYHNATGMVIMTICLVIYAAAVLLGFKLSAVTV